MNITRISISSANQGKQAENVVRIIKDAIICAKNLSDKKTSAMCFVNLGIIEGNKKYEEFV